METITDNTLNFKHTKLGLIPEEWEIQPLGVISNFRNGKGHEGIVDASGQYKLINSKFVSTEGKVVKFVNIMLVELFPGEITIVMSDVPNGRAIAKCFYVDQSNTYSLNQRIGALSPKKGLNSLYLYYYLNRNSYFLRFDDGVKQTNLRKDEVLGCPILLPPYSQQQKIAEILSTWDEAIEKVQQLIKQLELRKKGLIQRLITGKKRLPGFDGEWKELKAEKIFSNHSDKSHNGEFEVLSATQDKGVIPRSEVGIDIKYDRNSLTNYKKVDAGDFVISLRSFQGGIEYSSYNGLVSPAYTVLKEKLPISKKFYTEYLKSGNFIQRLNSIIYGIRDGKQISYKEFSTLKLWYPPIEEQHAISKFMDITDKDIKSHISYLEQLKIQKKGLMQQLLTGKIRVKIDE
jgi:type I restriction enzyme S subunit